MVNNVLGMLIGAEIDRDDGGSGFAGAVVAISSRAPSKLSDWSADINRERFQRITAGGGKIRIPTSLLVRAMRLATISMAG
jgi:hypothetical protein